MGLWREAVVPASGRGFDGDTYGAVGAGQWWVGSSRGRSQWWEYPISANGGNPDSAQGGGPRGCFGDFTVRTCPSHQTILAQRCRATAVSGRGACWRCNICFTGFVPHATVTMPLQPHEAEQGIKSRAAQVAEPAEWIGFFEWFTIARFYEVNILLVFGNNIFDVHEVFGKGFPHISRPRRTT